MSAIHHDSEHHRFTMAVEGQECVLDYVLDGKTMTITHTGVPSAVAGRGLAGKITQYALDYAREHHWKVVPACSYVAVWIERHPEYQPLLAVK